MIVSNRTEVTDSLPLAMRDTGLASKRQYPAVLPASADCGAASVGTKNTMLHLAYKAYSKDGEHCIS